MARAPYVIKLLVRGMARRPWGSLATLAACWFAVCLLVLVFHAAVFANKAKTLRGTTSTLVAYLDGRQQDGAVRAIGERIAAMEEVEGVEFIPCRAGLERLKDWLGPDDSLVGDLDPEILPDAFEVRLRPGHAGSIEQVAQRLEALPEVDEVRYDRGILGFLADEFYPVMLSVLALSLVVVLCLSLVVFLSIRVGMVSRRREMEVLHLLGARRGFLYSPYLLEAFVYGAGAALLALLTVEGGIALLASRLPVLGALLVPMTPVQMAVTVVLSGLLGLPAACLAIERSTDG